MIRIGTAGIPLSCKNCDSIKAVEYVRELGLNAMELEFVRGVNLSEEKAKKVGEKARDLDVYLSAHAPYYINLSSEDPEKIKASIKRIEDSLRIGEIAGAKVVVVHAGYYGKDKERASKLIEKGVKIITEKISKNKWEIFLGLETMGKQTQWGTLEEIVELCKKYEKCMPVVDFAHIFARNGGRIDYDYIFEKLSELNLDFYHSHFSGINFSVTLSGGNEKNHLPIKEAKGPDFEELAKRLINLTRDITIISESPILEEDALFMKQILEKMGYNF